MCLPHCHASESFLVSETRPLAVQVIRNSVLGHHSVLSAKPRPQWERHAIDQKSPRKPTVTFFFLCAIDPTILDEGPFKLCHCCVT